MSKMLGDVYHELGTLTTELLGLFCSYVATSNCVVRLFAVQSTEALTVSYTETYNKSIIVIVLIIYFI